MDDDLRRAAAAVAADGFAVVRGFWPRSVTSALRARAAAATREMDLASLRRRGRAFTTSEQQRAADAYFLTSGDVVRPFFEDDADHASLSVNKLGHALHELDFDFRAHSKSRAVAALLRELGFQKPIPCQSMLIVKGANVGGEVNAHQDGTFLVTQPQSVVGLWWALEKATTENGCLYIVPGSHRQGVNRLFLRNPDGSIGTVFEPPTAPPLDMAGAVPVEADEGDLVILHGAVVHFSCANTSPFSRNAYAVHVVDGVHEWHPRNWLQSRFFDPLYDLSNPAPAVPIIDISPFLVMSLDGATTSVEQREALEWSRLACARALDEAMMRWGTAVIVGHGVPTHVSEAIVAAARSFFSAPLPEKNQLRIGRAYGDATYNPPGTEAVARSSTSPLSPSQNEADQIESLYFSENPASMYEALARLSTSVDMGGTWADSLLSAAQAYSREMQRVTDVLLTAASVALGLPPTTLGSIHEKPCNVLKLSRYPVPPVPTKGAKGEFERYGAHTDYQGFTVLLSDPHDSVSTGGLQILLRGDGFSSQETDVQWVTVPHVPGGLVVNAGDFFPVWTRGRWHSPTHRVVGFRSNARDRISVPWFTGPNAEAMVGPLIPAHIATSNAAAPSTSAETSRSMRAGEWLNEKRMRSRV